MIRETHYTLSEAFELIGRHLHGDVWLGGEAYVSFCRLNEDDIVMLRAGPEKAVEKAVEPSRSPGGSGSGSAPGQKMRILDHAHDEHKKPDDISMAAVLSKKWLEEGIAKESARVEQLMVDDGSVNFKPLWGPPTDEALWRLRAGEPLTEADIIILDELEKEYHANERHESVVLWIKKHAWLRDDSEVPLTGYIHTPDDGKITPIKAHCWGARSFSLLTLSDRATMDDWPWPADGVLVFRKNQLDAILGDPKVVTTPPDDQLQRAAEPHESSIAAPGARAEATAAQKRQRPQGGRRLASQSQAQKVWEEFDRVTKPELLTFTRGEFTKIARGIAEKTGYKRNTVEKLIRSAYREKEEKRPSA